MVVDSSALPEQVVRDVLASAFDSAGQRCSALRILCVQEEIADELMTMLRDAVGQLRVGDTRQLSADVGPVISAQARQTINSHIDRMREAGLPIMQLPVDDAADRGTFVAPAIIDIHSIDQLGREVFGPVLHVLRYRRNNLREVMRQIRETGYGLTFGVHSRIDETIAEVIAVAEVGNVYVNRNVIGAIVGVQPFGGRGLSGTGPKAGGPLYLGRLVTGANSQAQALGSSNDLCGPVGERNVYSVHPRGKILMMPSTLNGLKAQLEAVQSTGNTPVLPDTAQSIAEGLSPEIFARIEWVADWHVQPPFAHVLIEDTGHSITPILQAVAAKEGPIPIVQLGAVDRPYRTDWMLEEMSVSIDTTAAGGNASLMALA